LTDELLNVELLLALAFPVGVADADSVVPAELPAALVVAPKVPAKVPLAALDLFALAFSAALEVEEPVADLVLLALLAAVELLELEALLLADWFAVRLALLLELDMEVSLLEEVFVEVELLEAL
jgi:hypothetical protein